MRRFACALMLAAIALLAIGRSTAFAQGSTKTALSGTVLDASGGALPGATVVVKNNRTGVSTTTVTNPAGAFDVPAVDAGIYTVTVSLNGFRTVVLTDVELLSGTARGIKVTLEVGAVTQQVEVVGGSQLVQTQATTVSSTVRTDQNSNLPLITRNTLDFVVFVPGVDTGSSNHSQRSSTASGLPQSAISITVDGAEHPGQYHAIHRRVLRQRPAEARFDRGSDRVDSHGRRRRVGAGAVQIKFATRSGTNQFVGSG